MQRAVQHLQIGPGRQHAKQSSSGTYDSGGDIFRRLCVLRLSLHNFSTVSVCVWACVSLFLPLCVCACVFSLCVRDSLSLCEFLCVTELVCVCLCVLVNVCLSVSHGEGKKMKKSLFFPLPWALIKVLVLPCLL